MSQGAAMDLVDESVDEYDVEGDAESISKDIDALLENAINTEALLSEMEEYIKGLQTLIESHGTVFLDYNGMREELKEVIERLHTESLENILKGGEMTFGRDLLHILQSAGVS
jgi:hypothetical protein